MREQREKEKVEWNKPRIILFLFVFILLLFTALGIKGVFLSESKKNEVVQTQNVSPNIDIRKGVSDQIEKLRTDAQNIDVVEIASSSPQVQKIIKDLKGLQNLPASELKKTCERICSGL